MSRFNGKICPADVARDVAGWTHRRLGELLSNVRVELEDGGMPLNEIQEAAILANASQKFDGLEQYVREVVVEAISSSDRVGEAVAS